MNSDKLNYFLTTAKYLNISTAAQQLYISQPALSRQLNAIEEEWGIKLFHKTTKKMELTSAGQLLYQQLPLLLDEYQVLLKQALCIQETETNQLTIGFMEGHTIPQLLISAINEFTQQYPSIPIQVSRLPFYHLAEALYEKKLDFIFTVDFNVNEMSNIYIYPISTAKTTVAISTKHPNIRSHYKTLADFREETMIIISQTQSSAGAALALGACKKAGFTPKTKAAKNFDEFQLLIETGQGIGIIGDYSLLQNSKCIKTFSFPELLDRNYVLAWHKDNISRPLLDFSNILHSSSIQP